ncbi:MAG TPA: hypothetical protein VKF14_13500 [Candidatus Dormibacteraeota bacterium]|nr:hypothetical protein [Candidatus Dormibacteraeota bacterium]
MSCSLGLNGPRLQVALPAHRQERRGEQDKHSRLDEPLDDDQPDDRVRLGGG